MLARILWIVGILSVFLPTSPHAQEVSIIEYQEVQMDAFGAATPTGLATRPCSPRLLPMSSPEVSAVVQIAESRFGSLLDSQGAVSLTNLSTKSLVRATFAIEYRDLNGIRILTMVYDGGVKAASARPISIIHTPMPDDWKKPLGTPETVLMNGYSALVTSSCPAVAELTVLELLYADGTNLSWRKANFKLDATIKNFPRQIASPPAQPHSTQPYVAVLDVMANGEVGYPVRFLNKPESEPVLKWTEAQIRSLEFYPASEEGSPQQTQIAALLFFPGKSIRRKKLEELISEWRLRVADDVPLVLINWGPGPPGTGWLFFYGNLDFSSSTTVRTLRASPPT